MRASRGTSGEHESGNSCVAYAGSKIREAVTLEVTASEFSG